MMRTSTEMSRVPPTRRKLFVSRIFRSFGWTVPAMSPISSRKTLPPSATSRRPRFIVLASVKAPRSWPKSSESSRFSLSPAQLISMKGLSRRALLPWIARATRSLPGPLPPQALAVVGHLPIHPEPLQGLLHLDIHLLQVGPLGEEVGRSHLHGSHRVLDLPVPGQHDDGGVWVGGAELLEGGEAVPVGQLQVGEEDN